MSRSEDKENSPVPSDSGAEFITPETKVKPEPFCEGSVFSPPLAFSQPSTAGTSAEYVSDDEEVGSEEGEGTRATCSKEKSLGLLCQRFIEAMKEAVTANDNSVHLETIAVRMKVEKRRIYDIVNVMEALDAMSKLNKSYYAWHGLSNLPRLMLELQREAIDENLPSKLMQVEKAMCSFTDLSPVTARKKGWTPESAVVSGDSPVTLSPVDSPFSSKSIRVTTPTISLPTSSPSSNQPHKPQQLPDQRGTKNSLAMLCRRFIMVLLANPQERRRCSLDVASTVLIKDTETEGFEPPSRGRCRRLYDIANVLVAMGIIKKANYLFGTKKIPLFIYNGPEPNETDTLSDEKLAEMMVLPRKDIDDCIREKTFGKRSKSEAYLDDAMRQQRSGKQSRLSSPHDSPTTLGWKIIDLANVADAERQRMQERLQFVIPSGSPIARKRLTQSMSNVMPSGSFSPSSSSSFPTSPLVLASAGQFALPRAPLLMYRTYSDLSVVGTNAAAASGIMRSPRVEKPSVSPLSSFNGYALAAAAAAAVSSRPQQLQEEIEQSSSQAARRALAPLQPSVTSPLNSPQEVSPKKTPKYSIKNILRSPAFRSQQMNETPEKEKVRIGTLEHRGNSLFKIVKKETVEEKRRPFGSSSSVNNLDAEPPTSLEQLRKHLGI